MRASVQTILVFSASGATFLYKPIDMIFNLRQERHLPRLTNEYAALDGALSLSPPASVRVKFQTQTVFIPICCQLALLVYHQVTTLFDFYPFNGSRNYTRKEKLGEAGSNGILMSLAPIGFGFHIKGLMIFGVVYYFVLFAAEIIIWWIPYLTAPSGRWRGIYNRLLSCAISNFEKGDILDHWKRIYRRLHHGTITVLPARDDRPVPNLEHTILHVWTLITALVTTGAYFDLW